MEWVYLLVGGALVLFGIMIGATMVERATDRAHKWSVGLDPDEKVK